MRTSWKHLWEKICPAILLVAAAACCAASHGQSSGGSSSGSGSATGGTTGAPQKGFAIESEMLTYTALDTEGAALSCQLAKNLGAADASCTPHAMSVPAGIVVVSSNSSALSEFQLWRTDIATMDMLTLRANHYCPQAQTRSGSSPLSTLMSMFPESEAVSFAQSLLSAEAETAPLEGNILDKTMVNDIAGHLREMGLSVAIPDTYMAASLMSLDEAHSPFLARFVAMMRSRACLMPTPTAAPRNDTLPGVAGKDNAEQCPAPEQRAKDAADEADKLAIVQAIDAFLKSLNQPEAFKAPKEEETTPSAAPAPSAPTISHLSAVLRADGLAQQLGAGSSDERSGANGRWYVLWLKALESGGTLLKSGNLITGTKTSYSGGAVGTYALFRLNGELECSGAFYNMAGPWKTGDIQKMLPTDVKTPPGRLVGGCNPNMH